MVTPGRPSRYSPVILMTALSPSFIFGSTNLRPASSVGHIAESIRGVLGVYCNGCVMDVSWVHDGRIGCIESVLGVC